MADPMGRDPIDPVLPARHVGEIVSEIEPPVPPKPSRPKVRFANYDQPEALTRHVPEGESASSGRDPASAHETEPASPQATSMSASPVPDPIPTPAQTALARPTPPLHKPGKLGRAIGIAKTVLPIVSKMLPLLEGNVVSAASNLLIPNPVDLKPLEEAIARLQSDQRALTFHTTDQKRALRRIQDEFDALQESVHKNAVLQAELAEHVAKLAKRTASFHRLIVILLVLSVLFTAFLCVRIAYLIHF